MTTYINKHLLDQFQKAFQDKLLELLVDGWQPVIETKYSNSDYFNCIELEKDRKIQRLAIDGAYLTADRWNEPKLKAITIYFGEELVTKLHFVAQWHKNTRDTVVFIPGQEVETIHQKKEQRRKHREEPIAIYEKQVTTNYQGFRKAIYRKTVIQDYDDKAAARHELVNKNGRTFNLTIDYGKPKKVA